MSAIIFSTGKPAEIHYGTGAISGFFSQDHVKVGDLVVKNQVELHMDALDHLTCFSCKLLECLILSCTLSGFH